MKAYCVVAHPDDDIIFAPPYIFSTPWLDWKIVILTYQPDSDRFVECLNYWNRFKIEVIPMCFVDRIADLKENTVSFDSSKVENVLRNLIHSTDLVLTHGPSGEYGHPHHIFLSSLITSSFDNVVHFCHESTSNALNIEFQFPLYNHGSFPVHQQTVSGYVFSKTSNRKSAYIYSNNFKLADLRSKVFSSYSSCSSDYPEPMAAILKLGFDTSECDTVQLRKAALHFFTEKNNSRYLPIICEFIYNTLCASSNIPPSILDLLIEMLFIASFSSVSFVSNYSHAEYPNPTFVIRLRQSLIKISKMHQSIYINLALSLLSISEFDYNAAYSLFSGLKSLPNKLRHDYIGAYSYLPPMLNFFSEPFSNHAKQINWVVDSRSRERHFSSVVLFVCDIKYFRAFSENILSALADLNADSYIHFHLVATEPLDKEYIRHISEDYESPISLSTSQDTFQSKSYYATARFQFAEYFLSAYKLPLLISDVDANFKRKPSDFINEYINYDVGLLLNSGFHKYIPWRRVSAGVVLLNYNPNSIKFARLLNVVCNGYTLKIGYDDRSWWIDQNILNTTYIIALNSGLTNIANLRGGHLPWYHDIDYKVSMLSSSL